MTHARVSILYIVRTPEQSWRLTQTWREKNTINNGEWIFRTISAGAFDIRKHTYTQIYWLYICSIYYTETHTYRCKLWQKAHSSFKVLHMGVNKWNTRFAFSWSQFVHTDSLNHWMCKCVHTIYCQLYCQSELYRTARSSSSSRSVRPVIVNTQSIRTLLTVIGIIGSNYYCDVQCGHCQRAELPRYN